MENKLNIAELLKDCPKGTKFYSPIFGEVYLDKIRPHLAIVVTTDKEQGDFKEEFLYDGRYGMNGECMLFPSKGKTTWEGFVPPCQFKNGDVLFHSDSASNGIFIFKEILQCRGIQKVICYCDYDSEDGFCLGENHTCCYTDSKILHLATKEQREILFQKMKEAGYKWNAETKTLEKLIKPKFKVGDKIRRKGDYIAGIVVEIDKDFYYKVEYNEGGVSYVNIESQNDWELVHDKFDISTLKPFDKVLVRDRNKDKWNIGFYGFYDIAYDINYPYECCGNSFAQCIPYECNEHLLGTTDDCDEYYKIW